MGEKVADISELVRVGAPIAKIAAEIECCEVVCANCHRRRTTARQRSWRVGLSIPDSDYLVGPRWRQRRNILHVRDVLSQSSCVDCGEADVCVLEFDHVGDKKAAVSALARGEYSLSTLAAEIAKCEVRCVNCHRRRTGAEW